MMFRLDLFSAVTFEGVTSLYTPDIAVERWSKRINAPGKLAFSIKATNPKASVLSLFQRVKLYRRNRDGARGYTLVWSGFIEDAQEMDGRIEIICTGLLGLFAKRSTAKDQAFTGQGSADAFSLLSACNAAQDTGITQGGGGVTSTKAVTMQGRVDVLKAWELLAQAHEAEFEISDLGAFTFAPSLGQETALHLTFRRDGSPGTNTGMRRGESGEDMANRVYGSSSNVVAEVMEEDEESQGVYGLLEEPRQFSEAQDSGTLQSMARRYLSQRSSPLPDLQVIPDLAKKRLNIITGSRVISGLQYTDAGVGDLITATIITENQSVTSAKRIAEITVSVDHNGLEQMAFTLSKPGVFITAGYLDASRVSELTKRVRQLESVVS